VRPLTWEELDHRWADLEAAADATPGIDPWCSGPDWLIPVATGFAPDAPRLLLSTDDGTGFALLSGYTGDIGGRPGADLLSGLEPLWGFGCPILGPDPGAVAAELADHLRRTAERRSLLLPGLPPLPSQTEPDQSGGPSRDRGADRTTIPIASALSDLGRVGLGHGISRQVADLHDGFETWLTRRSARFRRNLRRAERAADHAGLMIVDAADDPRVFDRILAIERRSWKGLDDSGITSTEMATMYRAMVERLQARGRLLANVAVLDGRDVGYIIGGLRGRRYRGLQLSFTVDAQALSVGHLLQADQLAKLAEHDRADVYDLGMDFGYKRRWADRLEPSAILLIER
jgi:Acetyltransferase (GNAT) domain